ncbi:hypothetical protein YC2023_019590 [Brassica napus]
MDGRKTAPCRVAGRERSRACCFSRTVASVRGLDLSWMQAELTLRTLNMNRERLGAELDHRTCLFILSGSSSQPTFDGFGTGTPEPSPQSQSFSRSYGSILPTSLAYIVPLTRGCSPWRPDAVMSMTGCERHSVLRIFKGRRECTRHHMTRGALPAAGPYLRLSRFQGGQIDRLNHVQVPFTWNLPPLQPSKFSFEYLLLPPISAPTATPPARALGFAATAAPSYSSRPGSCPDGRV